MITTDHWKNFFFESLFKIVSFYKQFSLQSLGLRGHFYDQSTAKSPAQILTGKCEITPASLGMIIIKSPAVPLHCGDHAVVKTGT